MATSSIIAKIGLNSAGFKTGLARCRNIATGFKSSMSSMFRGVGAQILGTFGITAGVAGLTMLARKAIDTGSQISDMATHLRVGTTELQAMQVVARDAGIEATKFEMSLNNLNQKTIEACDGNENYRQAFNRLGIDLKSFAQLPLDKKMEVLAKAYKDSGESLSSLNDISALLGTKTGPQMLEVLDRIATEGMDNLTKSAVESGQVMDEETIAALDRAGDEIGKWQNKIIVAFGGFLADMSSSIGREQWGYLIGQKFAEVGMWIEETMRNIGNYILATFSTIFRYLNGKFSGFIIPIRNIFFEFIDTLGGALANFISLFNDSWAKGVQNALKGLETIKDASNELAEKDKNKGFIDIFSEEFTNAEKKNKNRKHSDLWSAESVDWWQKRAEKAERKREAEKQVQVEAERMRKEKYRKADSQVEIKEKESKSPSKKKSEYYNDSSLAKIGGGGRISARFDIAGKQLSESKRQSKLLENISENTEKLGTKSELLMK